MRYHEMKNWIFEGDVYAFKGTDGKSYEALVRNISFYRPPDETYILELFRDSASVYPEYIAASAEIMGRIVEGQEIAMPGYDENVFILSHQPEAAAEDDKFSSIRDIMIHIVDNRTRRTADALGVSSAEIDDLIKSVWVKASRYDEELYHDGLVALDVKNVKLMDEPGCSVVLNIPERYITLKADDVMECEGFDNIEDLKEYIETNDEHSYRAKAKEIYRSYYTAKEEEEF